MHVTECVCMHVHVNQYMHACLCMHVHVYACEYVSVYVCVHGCLCVWMHCVCVVVCMSAHMHVCVVCIHVCLYACPWGVSTQSQTSIVKNFPAQITITYPQTHVSTYHGPCMHLSTLLKLLSNLHMQKKKKQSPTLSLGSKHLSMNTY